jgi:hypothetical protein
MIIYSDLPKKERKQKLKEDRKEKLKTKIPKHIKKAFKNKKK